ncbi:MAG TPA: hypothetical protein DIU01_09760, partial [Flavobacterium sp.]|nr:hypothetical protein [Flavobacterium sp.]
LKSVFKKNKRNVDWSNPRNLRNYLNLCSKINVGTVRQFECFLWRATEQKMYRDFVSSSVFCGEQRNKKCIENRFIFKKCIENRFIFEKSIITKVSQ